MKEISNCLLLLLSRKPFITKNPTVKHCNGDEEHRCMSDNRQDEYPIIGFSSVPFSFRSTSTDSPTFFEMIAAVDTCLPSAK